MVNFRNDYCFIAHDEVLKQLMEYNNKTFVGYGLDEVSEEAKQLIKKEIKNENVDVHFLPGGTITNKVLISHLLRPYECVISCDSGHIATHETGTIEQSGHKVLIVPNYEGKIKSDDIKKAFYTHPDEHMVKPKMVYISQPTEFGTLYKKEELLQISKTCKELGLYLYVDGARLATAFTSHLNDITFSEFANLVDAFYIGGTKNGLILGEALVILNDDLKQDIRYSIKHFGGMYSKGFVTGIEFKTLFTNKLFFEIGKRQNEMANKLYNELLNIGVEFLYKQETNQIFPIFKNEVVEELKKYIMFEMWERGNEKSIIRFVTHYKVTDNDIEETIKIIKDLL